MWGASYVKAHRRNFMSLVQGGRSLAEYEAEFLRLSRYAWTLVATDYDKCVRFEEGLRYDLWVLIASQRERVFVVLVDKAKIVEEVKRTERERRDREKDQNNIKRDSGQRPKKRARFDRPPKVKAPTVVNSVLAVVQTSAPNFVWPLREVQQPFRGRGTGRGGNRSRRGQRALGRGAGTLFIYSVPYYDLIDIGFIHSYIASVVSVNLGLTAENTSREFSVISPLGQSIRVDRVYMRVPLEL
ncbi:uncharacterized protein LOC105784650 [Gossypium raimondii]|uniref:uncharacterized protein LOC105784650 n=1 Tax=Gossypium raimondii TaxID=29730 RepID=UPI00063AA733|nr:uncharacterized protein LOC105784650 [Gossypium raimondii]